MCFEIKVELLVLSVEVLRVRIVIKINVELFHQRVLTYLRVFDNFNPTWIVNSFFFLAPTLQRIYAKSPYHAMHVILEHSNEVLVLTLEGIELLSLFLSGK